jgi:hypothetical protein
MSLRGWAEEAQAAAGIAKALAPTAFVPDHLRVWTNPQERDPSKRVLDLESTVAQISAVLLAGQELEFGPMASLRAFVIIRGTVAMYAIAARALLLRHGHEIVVVEPTSVRAIVRGRRAGTDDWQFSTWDLDRAKQAGLYPGHPDGNWRKQTKSMLVARATAEVCRWIAADAMLGLPLLAEEVEDGDAGSEAAPDAATPESGDDRPASRGSRRRTTAARAALPAAPPLTVPDQRPPPEPESTQPPPGTPRPTRSQLNKLHAALKDIQITGPEEGLALVSTWAGRKVTSTGHLTRDEIDVVLKRLDALRAVRDSDRREDEPDEPPAEPPPDEPGQEGTTDAGTDQ